MEEIRKSEHQYIYIKGLTHTGKVFRPSDWAERLCGAVACATLPANKVLNPVGYNVCALPVVLDGVSSVKIYEKLKQEHPLAFEFLLNFARDNHLEVLR